MPVFFQQTTYTSGFMVWPLRIPTHRKGEIWAKMSIYISIFGLRSGKYSRRTHIYQPHRGQPELARYELKWPCFVQFSAQRRQNTRVYHNREHTVSPITIPRYGILQNWFWVSQRNKEMAKYELKRSGAYRGQLRLGLTGVSRKWLDMSWNDHV
jgi:hypothetical protein